MRCQSIELDGPRVLVKFTVDKDIRLGDRTEAAIKTRGLLGTKMLEVIARGGRPTGGPDSRSIERGRRISCPMRWVTWPPRSAA